MEITLNINGHDQNITTHITDTLMSALRGAGYFSVRYGSDSGETGAAAVLGIRFARRGGRCVSGVHRTFYS